MPVDSNVLVVQTFGGHNINDGTIYTSLIQGSDQVLARFPSKAVETDVPAKFPTFAFGQPLTRSLSLTITVNQHTQTNYEALEGYFDSALGQQYLVCMDDNSDLRRLLCFAEDFNWVSPATYRVSLKASTGVWENNDLESPAESVITVNGQTFNLTNSGNARAYPTFTITPNSPKVSSDSWTKRKRIVIANRSELPLNDPVGDGYPIDVTDGGIDSSALTINSDLTDLRLILNSEDYNRWPSPDGALGTATKVWGNLAFRPMLRATLATSIIANATSLTVNNAQGFGAWPNSGFFLIDTECIQYSSRTSFTLNGLTRGARATTAASHTSAAYLYWVEHPFMDLIYGYTAADAAPQSDDREPMISLATSTNALHFWQYDFYNHDDRRSRAWVRVFTDDISDTSQVVTNPSSQHIRTYEEAGGPIFEDALPAADKPRANNAEMNFPVPIKIASNAVTTAYNVGATLLFQIYALDLDGNESRLLTAYWTNGDATTASSSGDYLTRLRFNARIAAICGDLTTTDIGINSTDPLSINVTSEVLAQLKTDPRVVIYISSGAITLSCPYFFHFTLERTTTIAGFLIYNGSGLSLGITVYGGSATAPTDASLGGASTFSGSAGLQTAMFGNEVSLPSGDYWARITSGQYVGIHNSRTEPYQWPGWHALESDIRQIGTNDTGHQAISSLSTIHVNTFSESPIFGVLSRTSEPQTDASLQTGYTMQIGSVTAILDNTTPRTPKIVVGDDDDLYLANFTISNDSTGDYLQVFFPMSLNQTITIDCANRLITDGETGLAIPFSLTASNPTEWIYLSGGTNQFSFSETGVVNTTVATTFRSRWL